MNMKKIVTSGVMGVGLAGIGFAGLASAATLGAGNSISIESRDASGNTTTATCTINSVGSDGGQKAAMTAGHCGKEGDVVYLETQNGRERIGTIHKSEFNENLLMPGQDGHDYAIIHIGNEHELTNTSSSNSIVGSALGLPNATPMPIKGVADYKEGVPEIGDILVYKDGSTLGRVVGVTVYTDGSTSYHIIPVLPGDSGGNVYTMDGELVGITSRGPVIAPFFLMTNNNDAAIKHYNGAGGGNYEVNQGATNLPHERQGRSIFQSVPQAPQVDAALTQISNEVNDVVNNNIPQPVVPVAPQPAEVVNTVTNQSHIAIDTTASQVNGATNNMFTAEVGQVSGIAHDTIGQASATAHDTIGQINNLTGF